jgi:MYXO-CTERM domain-containing protein
MTCGKSYAHLLVTEDGKTPADPWTWPPTVFDYDEWYDVAHTVGREVFQRWDWLLAIEGDLAKMEDPPVPGPYPERDQLLFLLQDFADRLDGVQHVLIESLDPNGLTWESSIREAIATAEDGTCVLELLDAAAAYYQRPPLPNRHPDREPGSGDVASEGDDEAGGDPGGGLGGILMTGALALGAALLWRRHQRRKEGR